MKTEEDEAWEEMERRQGAGGFPAKRAMAANKLHWSDCAVHNAPAYPPGECDCDARLSEYAETLLEEATRSCNNIDEQRALDALMLDFHKPAPWPPSSVITPKYLAEQESKNKKMRALLDDDDDTQDYKRPWVGLTDEQRLAALVAIDPLTARLPKGLKLFAEAIEKLLKDQNT